MGGKLNLFDLVPEVEQQAQSGNIPDFAATGVPSDLRSAVNALERAKRAAIYGVMKASMKYVANIKDEEEFLGNTGDILINLFAIDSAVGRALYAARQTTRRSRRTPSWPTWSRGACCRRSARPLSASSNPRWRALTAPTS